MSRYTGHNLSALDNISDDKLLEMWADQQGLTRAGMLKSLKKDISSKGKRRGSWRAKSKGSNSSSSRRRGSSRKRPPVQKQISLYNNSGHRIKFGGPSHRDLCANDAEWREDNVDACRLLAALDMVEPPVQKTPKKKSRRNSWRQSTPLRSAQGRPIKVGGPTHQMMCKANPKGPYCDKAITASKRASMMKGMKKISKKDPIHKLSDQQLAKLIQPFMQIEAEIKIDDANRDFVKAELRHNLAHIPFDLTNHEDYKSLFGPGFRPSQTVVDKYVSLTEAALKAEQSSKPSWSKSKQSKSGSKKWETVAHALLGQPSPSGPGEWDEDQIKPDDEWDALSDEESDEDDYEQAPSAPKKKKPKSTQVSKPAPVNEPDIQQGEVVAKGAYKKANDDELTVNIGDVLSEIEVINEDWLQAVNKTTGEVGVIPAFVLSGESDWSGVQRGGQSGESALSGGTDSTSSTGSSVSGASDVSDDEELSGASDDEEFSDEEDPANEAPFDPANDSACACKGTGPEPNTCYVDAKKCAEQIKANPDSFVEHSAPGYGVTGYSYGTYSRSCEYGDDPVNPDDPNCAVPITEACPCVDPREYEGAGKGYGSCYITRTDPNDPHKFVSESCKKAQNRKTSNGDLMSDVWGLQQGWKASVDNRRWYRDCSSDSSNKWYDPNCGKKAKQ